MALVRRPSDLLMSAVLLIAVASAAVFLAANRTDHLGPPRGGAFEHHVRRSVNAAEFVGSIGVCTHIGYLDTSYGNLNAVLSSLSYLRINKVRDGLNTNAWSRYDGMANAGIKFSYVINAQHENPSVFLGHMHAFSLEHPGSIEAIEGPNEINYWPVSFADSKGHAAGTAMQRAIFSGARADPVLAGVRIYDLTLGGASPWEYLGLGDHSDIVDYTNAHIYYGGGQPGFYWSKFFDEAKSTAPGKPTVVTETGAADAHLSTYGVDAITQAKQILNSLVDAAYYGSRATYLYQLADPSSDPSNTDIQRHYGLFDSEFRPKPAAVAVRNFLGLLARSSAGKTSTGGVGYEIVNLPKGGRDVLFTKPNGTYDIAVWAEPDIWDEATHKPIAAPMAQVTVRFATRFHAVAVYDPLQSDQPLQVQADTDRVTVGVTDHPLIIEVSGGRPAHEPAAAGSVPAH